MATEKLSGNMAKEFLKQLQSLIDYVEILEDRLWDAKIHILRNIHLFSDKEIECMKFDFIFTRKELEEAVITAVLYNRLDKQRACKILSITEAELNKLLEGKA